VKAQIRKTPPRFGVWLSARREPESPNVAPATTAPTAFSASRRLTSVAAVRLAIEPSLRGVGHDVERRYSAA
jgi:hypothetical protein